MNNIRPEYRTNIQRIKQILLSDIYQVINKINTTK